MRRTRPTHSAEQVASAEQYVRDQLAIMGLDISAIGTLKFDQVVRDVLKHVPVADPKERG
jgi:hypothetical protein